MAGGNSHQRIVENTRRERIEKQVLEILSQILGGRSLSERELPYYETGSFWGGASTAIGIVIAVVAAMSRDVRWLLFAAVPFAAISWAVICKPLKLSKYHWRGWLLVVLIVSTTEGLRAIYETLPSPESKLETTVDNPAVDFKIDCKQNLTVTNRGKFPIKTVAMSITDYRMNFNQEDKLTIESYGKLIEREIAEVIVDKPFTYDLKQDLVAHSDLEVFYGFRFTFIDTGTSKRFAVYRTIPQDTDLYAPQCGSTYIGPGDEKVAMLVREAEQIVLTHQKTLFLDNALEFEH
jgi:hypothetical protein